MRRRRGWRPGSRGVSGSSKKGKGQAGEDEPDRLGNLTPEHELGRAFDEDDKREVEGEMHKGPESFANARPVRKLFQKTLGGWRCIAAV